MERWRGDFVAILAILIGATLGVNATVWVVEALPLEQPRVIDCACVPAIPTMDSYHGDPGHAILSPLPPTDRHTTR